MKAILFIGAILLILAASFSPGTGNVIAPSSAPSSLPPAQRTAIHAPAVATQSAGASLSDNAAAQAAAQEQEAARVYAQAVQDEQIKLRAVSTQQAMFATQTANDIAVSKEYATLAAVSIAATTEAISRTIAYDAEQYSASIAAIQATRQIAQAQAFDEMTKTGAADSIGYFWTWIPTAAALILFALFVIVLWKLINRIEPRIEEIEVEIPVMQARATEADPTVSKISGLNFTTADPRVLLTNIVIFSGRHIGWRQNRIAGNDEIGSVISDRAWVNAIEWGKKHYDLVTQRGPIKNGGGTYSQISMTDLHNRLILDPAIEAIPEPPPTPA